MTDFLRNLDRGLLLGLRGRSRDQWRAAAGRILSWGAFAAKWTGFSWDDSLVRLAQLFVANDDAWNGLMNRLGVPQETKA